MLGLGTRVSLTLNAVAERRGERRQRNDEPGGPASHLRDDLDQQSVDECRAQQRVRDGLRLTEGVRIPGQERIRGLPVPEVLRRCEVIVTQLGVLQPLRSQRTDARLAFGQRPRPLQPCVTGGVIDAAEHRDKVDLHGPRLVGSHREADDAGPFRRTDRDVVEGQLAVDPLERTEAVDVVERVGVLPQLTLEGAQRTGRAADRPVDALTPLADQPAGGVSFTPHTTEFAAEADVQTAHDGSQCRRLPAERTDGP